MKRSARNITVLITLSAAVLSAGCAGMNRADRRMAVGAAVGGIAGSVLTGGSTMGTVGGAVVGGVLGNQSARQYGRRDQGYHQQGPGYYGQAPYPGYDRPYRYR